MTHVDFVGHPFSITGKGEELRSSYSSLKSMGVDCRVYDVYRHLDRTDSTHLELFRGAEVQKLEADIRIWHINGDEVDKAVEMVSNRGSQFEDAYNIIVPAWELPIYPKEWCDAVSRFDEVWAISEFVANSLACAGIETTRIGQAVEMPNCPRLTRSYFGIRDSAFVFLSFMDMSSYVARKNPDAALKFFKRLSEQNPYMDIQLVLKLKNGECGMGDYVQNLFDGTQVGVIYIDKPLATYETHSLISACDCFVSLHRSEGFGRGAAEAMWAGRIALATGWSGNMDFMSGYGGAIQHSMVAVEPGEYIYSEGQSWAEPNIEHAVEVAQNVLDDHSYATDLRASGQTLVRQVSSFRAVGLRMLDRIINVRCGMA